MTGIEPGPDQSRLDAQQRVLQFLAGLPFLAKPDLWLDDFRR